MPDGRMFDAIDQLTKTGIVTPDQATDFREHRRKQRHLLEEAWRRADDLTANDPAAGEATTRSIYRALRTIRDSLGLDETEFP